MSDSSRPAASTRGEELLRARLEAALSEERPLRRRAALLDLADAALSAAAALHAPPSEPLITTSGGHRITERERLEAVAAAERMILELDERRVAREARVAAAAER